MQKKILLAILASAAMSASAHAQQTNTQAQPRVDETTAQASFVSREGKEIGTAKLVTLDNGVLIQAEVQNLPANSWVSVHVHEGSECDAPGGFQSAGGHFNPTGAPHGFLVATGPHAGDMPNQYVGSDGTMRADVFNPYLTLSKQGTAIQGRTLMIHGGQDDYESQPAGDAGDRIACAVIR